MKRILIISIVVLIATNTTLFAGPQSACEPIALSIIIDTSWTTERHIGDFKALSRQAIAGLAPGSYVEVISMDSAKPTIQIAQSIKTGAAGEIKAINDQLSSVKSRFLTNSVMSNGLQMALGRLKEACGKKRLSKAAAIVFSDGKLGDSDARKVVEICDQFARRNWRVYVTGTRETNKTVLIAANKKTLNWSLLDEANPGIWLQSVRNQQLADDEATKPSESKAVLEEIAKTLSRLKVPAPKPEVQINRPEPPQPPDEAAVEPEQPEPVTEPKAPTVTAPEPAPEDEPAERDPFRLRVFRFFRSSWWLLLIPVAAALAVGAALIIKSRAAAGKAWESTIGSRLKTKKSKSQGRLVVKVNGQSYQLGQLDRFRTATIGSGRACTVKIASKSVSDRHIIISQKAGRLQIRNLSRSPATVNGSELKRGNKAHLSLPATVQLSSDVRITVELRRVKPVTVIEKEANDGTKKQ